MGMPFGLNICVCSSHSFPSSPPLIFRKDFFLKPNLSQLYQETKSELLESELYSGSILLGLWEDGRLVPAVMGM